MLLYSVESRLADIGLVDETEAAAGGRPEYV